MECMALLDAVLFSMTCILLNILVPVEGQLSNLCIQKICILSTAYTKLLQQ